MAVVHLSFDLEEFDTPMEYGASIAMEEMIALSRQGTERILEIVNGHQARSTFFTTVAFAQEVPDLMQNLLANGHELASHGMVHSGVKVPELRESKEKLEELFGRSIQGFRAPRMGALSSADVKAAGYEYDSSLNPCFLPGRYNKFSSPRTIHQEQGLTIVPASVTPVVRIPLFWLTFHNTPFALYEQLCRQTLGKDGHIVLYFHPWEFAEIESPHLRLPYIIRHNSGKKMMERLSRLIDRLSKEHAFMPICENPR